MWGDNSLGQLGDGTHLSGRSSDAVDSARWRTASSRRSRRTAVCLKLIYFDFPFWRRGQPPALHLTASPSRTSAPTASVSSARASGSLPMDEPPVLDVDGVRIAQAVTIIHFCQVAGLYPRGPPRRCASGELLDACTDITLLLDVHAPGTPPSAELRQRLAEEIFPRWPGPRSG